MRRRAGFLCVGAAHWDLIARAGAQLGIGADVPGRLTRRPGGVALNIALALAALGQRVGLVAAIGRDGPGAELVAEIEARGVECRSLLRHAAATDCYLAIEDARGEVFAAIADCAGLEAHGDGLARALAESDFAPSVVVLDGNPAEPASRAIAKAAGAAHLALIPASPAKATRLRGLIDHPGATLIFNRGEAEALIGMEFAGAEAAARALIARGASEALVTDGARMAVLISGGEAFAEMPRRVETRGLTGAGDRLAAGFLAARAEGLGAGASLSAALEAAARHISCEVT